MKKIAILLLLLWVSIIFANESILIFPIYGTNVDSKILDSTEFLLRSELTKLENYDYKFDLTLTRKIYDKSAIFEIALRNNVDLALEISLVQLNKKVISSFALYDAVSKKIIVSDDIITKNIDDINIVAKRIASSVKNKEAFDKVAEVGNLVNDEQFENNNRRETFKFNMISFGYIYPVTGYDDLDDELTIDSRFGYEMPRAQVGMQIASRHGIAFNIYSSYLFSKSNICPYLGGLIGYHWVNHDSDDESSEAGIEFGINAGVQFFRTYNFKLVMNMDFIVTANDFNDSAAVLTIGLSK